MTDREKIRQEIERRLRNLEKSHDMADAYESRGLIKLLCWIETIMPPESQPVPSSFQFLEGKEEDNYTQNDGEPADGNS